IDLSNGGANGRPPFLHRFHDDIYPDEWQTAFAFAYTDLCHRVESLEQQLPSDFDPECDEHAALADQLFASLPMDSYASENPAEFFAVASETFFVDPKSLAAVYPEIYRLLSAYYLQAP